MKKIALILFISLVSTVPAYAQLGSLIRKAAQKTAEKAAEKAVDRATKEADKAIDRELDKVFTNTENETSAQTPAAESEVTYASLIKQAMQMPTAAQFVSYKGYEFNEQSFKMLASPVTSYMANIAVLTGRAAGLAYSKMDSAQVVGTAYDMASSYTGLSRDELEMLSKMSDEEQEVWLKTNYSQGRAEAAILNEATDAAKYLEPLQPTIDRWTAAGESAESFLSDADEQCRKIYGKYSDRLASAVSDKSRNEILLKYYAETAPIQREAALKAMQMRLDTQLPIAEELEKEMAKIRAQHKDFVSNLLNYPQLTVAGCMGDAGKVMEIKTY